MFSALRKYNRTIIVFVALALYASLFFLQQTNLVTSDLGRHLMNGKLVWLTVGQHIFGEGVFNQAMHDSVGLAQSPDEWRAALDYSIVTTNTYSYTNPDFGVINHHWFFGVLTYVVFLATGFSGLTLMNVVLVGSAIFITLVTAGHSARWQRVVVVAALLLPLVTNRVEIRPESVSLLLSALFTLVLYKVTRCRLRWKIAAILLLLSQLIWVNTHIFFILGFGITGIFWLESFVSSRKHLTKLTALGGLLGVVSLLNPNGVAGVLAPFGIFNNYDFMVAENQTTFFMLRVLPKPEHWYYLVVLGILAILFVILLFRQVLRRKKLEKTNVFQRHHVVWMVYLCVLAVAGLWLNRLYSFFGLLALPPLAWLLELSWQQEQETLKKLVNKQLLLPIFSMFGFALLWGVIASGMFFPSFSHFGAGFVPNNLSAAQFFANNRLHGPIFNNYDNGGYLIVTLFPQERVFTDNRPEAYPPGFFTNFKQAVADQTLWEKLLAQYDFSTIIFHRNDMTDHGQRFLIDRIIDPNWAPVFVDEYTLMLVRRSPENAEIIAHFELPQSMFSFSAPK